MSPDWMFGWLELNYNFKIQMFAGRIAKVRKQIITNALFAKEIIMQMLLGIIYHS